MKPRYQNEEINTKSISCKPTVDTGVPNDKAAALDAGTPKDKPPLAETGVPKERVVAGVVLGGVGKNESPPPVVATDDGVEKRDKPAGLFCTPVSPEPLENCRVGVVAVIRTYQQP